MAHHNPKLTYKPFSAQIIILYLLFSTKCTDFLKLCNIHCIISFLLPSRYCVMLFSWLNLLTLHCVYVFCMFSHCFFEIILVSSVNVMSFLAVDCQFKIVSITNLSFKIVWFLLYMCIYIYIYKLYVCIF